ncbi:MAG: phosphoribosylglycinamide formyltransferase [Flavobacteriales bacterium]
MSTHSEEVGSKKRLRIAVFASGSGSNALALMRRFGIENDFASVMVLVTNKPACGAVQHARDCGVEVFLITRENFISGDETIRYLTELQIDWIVLAGFLWKVPPAFVKSFEGRIINLHPSLLPKFGGKGMYGRHVHEAALGAKESITGITVHYVNERYDEGNIIFQASVPLSETDGVIDIEQKVRALESQHFCDVVDRILAES